MSELYTEEYFRARRMGESFDDPFDTSARALKGYRRGVRLLGGDLSDKRVLDVGCGLGAGSWLLAQSGARVTGVDVSEDAIEWARRTYSPEAARSGRHLDFWTADLLGVRSGLGEFDALTVVDVLEHFSPREGAELLGRLRGLLRPGGKMFLHVPVTGNSLDWLLVVKNGLLSKRLSGDVIDHHGDPTHRIRYSVRGLARILKKTGWTTDKVELRAYGPRLSRLERATLRGRRGPMDRLLEEVATDWDGVHLPTTIGEK
jgi:2-polyprenyl-3-methyl-5-hydroxy-6-metoxy-1,4-benzoquinol methylase